MSSQPRDLSEAPTALAAAALSGARDRHVPSSALRLLEEEAERDPLFQVFVESVRDCSIVLLEREGLVATWSAAAQRLHGYEAGEVVGRHVALFEGEPEPEEEGCASERSQRQLESAARTGRFERRCLQGRKDGSRFWAHVVLSAIRDEAGQLVGFSKVTRDLSSRRRFEQEAVARLAAAEAHHTKDALLAMLGHELRNPLAPITSALQLLKLRGDGRFAHEHQIIERQVEQMTRLVDDLLDVSRISRGALELQRTLLDLREPIAAAVALAAPLIERKGQTLELRMPDVALPLHGDVGRLTQVFTNLLTNAAKYTGRGGAIALAVDLTGRELAIEIRDNGVGVAPALLPRVFELFVQGAQESDRAEGGLGLGLALVQSLVALHGGSVEAHSGGQEPGSRFLVRLPCAGPGALAEAVAPADEIVEPKIAPAIVPDLAPAPASPAMPAMPAMPAIAAPARRRAASRRILVVDDNEDALMLLGELLTKLGHQVGTAPDGLTALTVCAELEPEVAILDIGLPGMDGYELARRIRQLPGGRDIRLLALTGYGQPGDKLRAHAAGFDAHLVKPLDLQSLLRHLDAPPAEPPVGAASEARAAPAAPGAPGERAR